MPSRWWRVVGLALVSLATAADGRGGLPAIDPAVRDAVASRGRATVHVVLRDARSLPPRPTPAQERAFVREVQRAQRAFRAALPGRGVRIERAHSHAFGVVAEVDAAGLEALETNPRAAWVYLDGSVSASLVQGVPLIKADVLQGLGHTGAGMTIAVLDTGIDYTHAALGGCFGTGCKVVDGRDYINNDFDPMDDGGHGTSVAGIAAGDGASVQGVAPEADLAALKVLAANGVGSFAAVDAALNWVLTNRTFYNIKVANLSLGDSGQYDDPGDPLCSSSTTAGLIRSLVNAGVAVTVASGNNAYDAGISFPACVPEATAVAGVYDADHGPVTWCVDRSCNAILCIDSTSGADVFICRNNAGSLLDLLAPSWKATTAMLGGGTRDLGGTSAAAPYAAGAFALMFGALPGADVASIEGNLAAHGVPVLSPGDGATYPRIDLQAALASFDPDVDQVPTASDNCPAAYNPSQADADLDGAGDACDNCPGAANPGQENADADPAGDACDCDDARADVYPGAAEVCDGVNNDCAHPAWPSLVVETDDDGDGRAECAGDCDDADPLRRSGFPEACDGVDNDCNGAVPANEEDADLDGFRICQGDCDDAHATVKPGAPEICDGLDNDCDFIIPPFEVDADRDGSFICGGDCDDARRTVHPGAPEICDGLDNDCDVLLPPGEADLDSDGVFVCGGDCDDDGGSVHPGAPEVCDGRNNDCDHPAWPSLAVETDEDGDGLAECGGDCDDADPGARPGRPEVCNERDDDCDGSVDPNHPYLTDVAAAFAALDLQGSEFDRFGASLAAVADLTGDGLPDLLAGAPAYPAGLLDRGSVVLLSGAGGASVRRMQHPSGSNSALLGSSVAAAGDVDGDGKPEVLAGAPSQHNGQPGQGRVVLFSGAEGSVVWTYDDPSLAASSNLGAAVARLGDLNGDGVAEVLAGAPGDCTSGPGCSGTVWILDGNLGQQVGVVSDLTDEPQERFGTAAAAVGDLNGDGKDDFAVGAPNRDTGGFVNSGAVLTFSGATGAFLNLLADPSPAARDQLGASLAAIADLDGDGGLDLVAGAPGHPTGAGLDVGQALILSAADGSLIRRLADPNGASGDRFGAAVAAVGDLDRDGLPDVAVGAPGRDAPGAPDAGAVYLLSSRTGALMARITHPLPGEGDQLGSAVAAWAPPGAGPLRVAAGAPLRDETAGEDAGSIQALDVLVVGDCDGDGIRNGQDLCTDHDLDGYGSAAFLPPACPADCDDERATVHPGAPEVCDGLDSDCDAVIPPAEADADGDAWPICAGDCDDARASVHPGAPQLCDGLNNDCLDPSWPAPPSAECFPVGGLLAADVFGFVRLDWDVPPGGASRYRIYRAGRSDHLAGRNGGFCRITAATNTVTFEDDPGPGGMSYFLVAGVRGGVEGSRGADGDGVERSPGDVCP